MLAFHLVIIDSKSKNLQGIFQTTMLAPFFFTNVSVPEKKEVKYSRHFMLASSLLWVVISADYFLKCMVTSQHSMLNHLAFS